MLHLPSTKTSPVRGEDVALVAQPETFIDAPRALLHHLKTNHLAGDDGLFCYRTSSRSPVQRLTSNMFLARCNQVWAASNIPRITGHSFRIGGTTELLTSGVEPDVVRAMGRWSSDSFLKYWRSLEHLIPKHVRNRLYASPNCAATNARRKRHKDRRTG
ncbi:hypothetical protein SCHPADRAFT_847516 [Schizopora paradoxa]|uniref:DNA breaking-rejoining enzyme n=1 Tax=Schizopora paradoxa TaxID=27342 RepID=A0A0H2RYV9_9AGAM|nr:hypothetical protein SCHPADRAFT_847516 [Schizopora paradoxa]